MLIPKAVLPMLIAGCSVMVSCPEARAEERFFGAAEAGFMAPLNDPYGDTYGFGAHGGLAVFRSLLPQLALGMRASYGVLTEEEEAQAGGYNFGALSAALRLRPLAAADDRGRSNGLWVEGAAGGALVEGEKRFIVSPGLGYSLQAGGVGVGPFARYIQVVEEDFEDARLGVIGVEVTLFGSSRPDRRAEPPPTVPVASTDRDGDGIVDAGDGCPEQPETMNGVNDHDGCPDQLLIVFANDRLVIDEDVFFDYDKAELRPNGQGLLREIAAEYQKAGGGWAKLTIQGHADRRGPEEYNEQLSRERAQAVKQYLVSQGVPAETLDVEAYGERRPAVPGADTPAEFQKNRRVEFVIQRR
jgi:OOP family OmpA-OmpF porin